MNIGFLAFRPSPQVIEFMADISDSWIEELSRRPSAGTSVAIDQDFFNNKLTMKQKMNWWKQLDRNIFALDGPGRHCQELVDHRGDMVVFHLTGHTIESKIRLQRRFYDGDKSKLMSALLDARQEDHSICRGDERHDTRGGLIMIFAGGLIMIFLGWFSWNVKVKSSGFASRFAISYEWIVNRHETAARTDEVVLK